MAKTKVTVGIYTATRFNSFYSAGTAISEEKFEEFVQKRADELKREGHQFEDYLCDYYTYQEVFDMSDEEKAEVLQEYADKCVDWARDELDGDWEYSEVEVEVEVPTAVAPKQPKGKCHCPCNL